MDSAAAPDHRAAAAERVDSSPVVLVGACQMDGVCRQFKSFVQAAACCYCECPLSLDSTVSLNG